MLLPKKFKSCEMAHTDLKWLVLDLLTPQMSLQKQLYKNKLREDFSARAAKQLIIDLAVEQLIGLYKMCSLANLTSSQFGLTSIIQNSWSKSNILVFRGQSIPFLSVYLSLEYSSLSNKNAKENLDIQGASKKTSFCRT